MNKNETLNKVVRAALYIRVSSEEQVRHGYSLSSQKQRLLEYCKQNKYKVVDLYADEGKSARTKLKNRKELLRLIEDAKRGKFDRIIFWRLDRWFRNIADYYKIQEILDQYKIDWECTDEEYNTTTSNGRLHLNIKLSIAQNESDQTSDRIKFNFNMMVQNGKAIVGKQGMPLGYTIAGEKKNKKMIKDPNTEYIANDMWESIKNTGSIRKTLIYINNKYKLNICYDSMRHYFMNEKYYGYYRGNKNYCPAYVTKKEFDEIQALVTRNVKMNKRHDYIFSGLLKCPVCGRNLAGFTSKTTKSHGKKVEFKYPSYRCNYKYQGNCNYHKRPVEKTVEQYLLNNIEEEINKYIIEINKLKEKDEFFPTIDVEKLKKKVDRLTDLYIEGRISKEKYDKEYNKTTDLINANSVSNKENIDLSNLKKVFKKDTIEIYRNLSNENKRNFWASFIDYIEIMEDNEYIIHFKKEYEY